MSRDDVFTLKEMMERVLVQNEKALVQQTEILAKAVAVDLHLKELNSKVATNVTKIAELRNEHTILKSYATAVSFIIGLGWTAINFIFK